MEIEKCLVKCLQMFGKEMFSGSAETMGQREESQ